MDGRYDAEEAELHPLEHDGGNETVGVHGDEDEHVPYQGVSYPEDVMLQRSQAFLEDMRKRRTLRFFSSKPVPREVIENIIRTAGELVSTVYRTPGLQYFPSVSTNLSVLYF